MEVNPEELIGRYWQAIKQEFPELDKHIERLEFKPGISQAEPVDLAQFLSYLHCDPLLAPFKLVYQRFEVVKPRLAARLRFVSWFKQRRFRSIRSAHSHLKSHPEVWQSLGFKRLPTYELLREFLNERLPGLLKKLNDLVNQAIGKELEQQTNQRLFEEVSEDAVDLRARDSDEEAEWSGYYKEQGYKVDLAVDRKTGVIATPIFLGINEGEGDCFPEQAERQNQLGFKPRKWNFDGAYASKENIAIGSIGHGMEMLYKIQANWVRDPKGTPEQINRTYQKHWKEPGFLPGVGLEYQLEFLYKIGELERVGAYLRNKAMESYEANPGAYLRECNWRSKSESTNSHLKEELDLERGIPKGKKRAECHVRLCVLARNLVALTRLQQGVTKNLTSLAYLT
jgi:hypothetical protein